MGWSGFSEYICEEGLYYTVEANLYKDEEDLSCPGCGSSPKYHHFVETTNGKDETCHWTFCTEKEKVTERQVEKRNGRVWVCPETYAPSGKYWDLFK